jgi:hypothetical protein
VWRNAEPEVETRSAVLLRTEALRRIGTELDVFDGTRALIMCSDTETDPDGPVRPPSRIVTGLT